MTELDINEIAERAAEKAIEKYRMNYRRLLEEAERENIELTKYALRKYRQLKENSENGVDSIDWDLAGRIEKVYLPAVTRRALKDMTMLEYIDMKLRLFKKNCESSPKRNEQRGWEIISMMYIEPYTYTSSGTRIEWTSDKIAEEMKVDRSTVFSTLNWSYAVLSGYLWGITF